MEAAVLLIFTIQLKKSSSSEGSSGANTSPAAATSAQNSETGATEPAAVAPTPPRSQMKKPDVASPAAPAAPVAPKNEVRREKSLLITLRKPGEKTADDANTKVTEASKVTVANTPKKDEEKTQESFK
ncbi:unnamed protein product [Bursaphelenchus okinawaensis]|uniref:Uncharacterized protein n=1 Tax=Bursaphelenchus okinawaensis TaxID=465554 RepID=A0A811KMR4_9BILA|nr:unnamed protein product [Bursaphelenchus okinawaensis]CAG9105769.1 unnamed protein product [Bursaphelenchus okinawaensis]